MIWHWGLREFIDALSWEDLEAVWVYLVVWRVQWFCEQVG